MDANKEIRNDELKTAMITLKLQDDKESENYFIEELRKAFFIVPAVDDGKSDELTLMLLSDQNNNNYFQAYTDLDEYNKWSKEEKAKYFILRFDEYANIVISSDEEVKGLVINPFTENIIVDKDFLNRTFKMGKIFIDEEKECSKEVKSIIKKVLKQEDKVLKGYLFNIEKDNIPGYLLVLETKAKDKKKLFDEVGTEILKHVEQINIDIIDSKDNAVKEILKNKKEIYVKK
ncbi:MAG: enhanced serine sensitivity protein SseB C-terminal domain-containing protein [Bacilli bacterium]|nr:enhanced serine sensitivity protein SseB C-terminal domain-containing protein [Bacilli bacterium]